MDAKAAYFRQGMWPNHPRPNALVYFILFYFILNKINYEKNN